MVMKNEFNEVFKQNLQFVNSIEAFSCVIDYAFPNKEKYTSPFVFTSGAVTNTFEGNHRATQIILRHDIIYPESMEDKVLKHIGKEKLTLAKVDYAIDHFKFIHNLNNNFSNITLPRLLNVLKHELTHYEQIILNKKHEIVHNKKYGDYGKEYFYDQMEIGAFANQFADMLIKHKVPVERLGDRKYMLKKIQDFLVLAGDDKKFYFNMKEPEAKKFWKYVYQYLEQHYNNDKI